MALYRSNTKNLKIIMTPSYLKEVRGRTIVEKGKKVEFQDGLFETEDEDIIDFLENDPGCKKMKKRGVFVKIDKGAVQEATKEETLEEREARLRKEMEELKKQKAKQEVKEEEEEQEWEYPTNEDGEYECQNCGKTYKTKKYYENHIEDKHDGEEKVEEEDPKF